MKIINLLASHDWYYYQSDDPVVFQKGVESERKLLEELKKYDRDDIIHGLQFLIKKINDIYNQK
jgi:hypothetical protein